MAELEWLRGIGVPYYSVDDAIASHKDFAVDRQSKRLLLFVELLC
jgi:hypothetical protein